MPRPAAQGPRREPPASRRADSRAADAARDLAEGLQAMTGEPAESAADATEAEAEVTEAAEVADADAEPAVAAAADTGPDPDTSAAAADAEVAAEVVADPAGAPDAPESSDDDLAEAEAAISSDFQTLAKERDDYLNALRRLQADFENYKKRMMRQQTATLERAAEDLVSKLLPVLDTIDLARQHGGGEAVEQVAASLLDVLGKEGLERVEPAGKPFDPNEHEAVAHQEGDGEPEVVDVMRAGYRWRGRLLRPAMVSVKG